MKLADVLDQLDEIQQAHFKAMVVMDATKQDNVDYWRRLLNYPNNNTRTIPPRLAYSVEKHAKKFGIVAHQEELATHCKGCKYIQRCD